MMPNFENIVRIIILSYTLLGSEIYLNKIIIKEGVNKREKTFWEVGEDTLVYLLFFSVISIWCGLAFRDILFPKDCLISEWLLSEFL